MEKKKWAMFAAVTSFNVGYENTHNDNLYYVKSVMVYVSLYHTNDDEGKKNNENKDDGVSNISLQKTDHSTLNLNIAQIGIYMR